MRFYPQDQDTGGFFVTVLEKKADAPRDDVKPDAAAAGADDVAMSPQEATPVESEPCVYALWAGFLAQR